MKQLLCLLLAVILVCGAVSLESVLAVEGETTQETEAQTGETVQEPETESVEKDSESEETELAAGAETELSTNTEQDKYANRISGVLWIDANEDGTYDSGEQALADYPVYLYLEGDTDNAVQTATTDANGTYRFEDISPGRYVVGIKAEENGTEYLLPLVGVQKDNKFCFAPDYSKVISNPIDIVAETVVEDIDAAMRIMPQIQPMANTTYTIDLATVTTATAPTGTIFSGSVLTFTGVDPTDSYIITTSVSTARYIIVNSGVTANITLSGVTISSTVSPFRLLGTANVDLKLSGTNTLTCTGTVTAVGNYQAGLYLAPSATLTIDGTGTLNATAGSYSAGIGGSYMSSSTASSNSAGTIIISDGIVTATGGGGGAGIGGGNGSGSGGSIAINGGTVTANAGTGGGAGIGGGNNLSLAGSSGGAITITGGTVNAISTNYGAGIGGGGGVSTGIGGGDGGTIIISNGIVNATGTNYGAGIGGGGGTSSGGSGGNITISGGTVTAKCIGYYGAGIGGAGNTSNTGSGGSGGTVNITGGTITATGGSYGAGIGGGSYVYGTAGSSGNITISGGTVTAAGGSTGTARDIGYAARGSSSTGSIVFIGGSILPTRGTSYVSPSPTNGSSNGNDPVGMLTLTSLAGQVFTINTSGSLGPYTYKGVGHTDAAYPWLTYPGVSTDAATVNTTAASVTAPSTVNSAATSTATLNGTYYLNNTYPVTQAYFEWGTSTTYGTTIDMTSSVNISEITTAARSLSSPALTDLTPGVAYHYRLVIVTNSITVRGNDMSFTTPALAPSVDVIHDYPGGTTATLEGIYDLNGGTFVSGKFEISDDGGSTWSTPTGGTLTGSTTTPSVTLTGLTPGTTYHYRLTVTNSEGATTTVMRELTVSAKTVTISNEVTGAYANLDKSFTFTIYFQDSGGTALTGTFTYTGGVLTGSGATAPSGGTLTLGSGGEATVTLTAGQTITIAGVATSAKVRVVQTTDANYTTSFIDSINSGITITAADTGVRDMTAADRTFDFTNARSVVPGGISTGSGGMVLLALLALFAAGAWLVVTAARRRTRAR